MSPSVTYDKGLVDSRINCKRTDHLPMVSGWHVNRAALLLAFSIPSPGLMIDRAASSCRKLIGRIGGTIQGWGAGWFGIASDDCPAAHPVLVDHPVPAHGLGALELAIRLLFSKLVAHRQIVTSQRRHVNLGSNDRHAGLCWGCYGSSMKHQLPTAAED